MATDRSLASPTGDSSLAALLRTWRRRELLSQEQLARSAGLSVRTIRRLEAGSLRPRGESVRLLARALGLSDAEQALLVEAALGPDHQARRVPGTPSTACLLPADVAGFTGRVRHLEHLDTLLAGDIQATAVVISAIAGTAGVGKTALAVHWAHRVASRFPDGQLYLDLRGYALGPPVSPLQALALMLHALGVPAEEIPTEADRAAGLYRSLLTGKRVLLVLDNARDAEQVRPLLPGAPGCLVLITSRDRLGGLVARDGARRLALDVLSPDEARALLARLLGHDRVRREAEAAAELARLCAFLPLALRIAAANLIDRPQQTIAGHAAELRGGDRLARLTVEGDEQGAVRSAFDLSYRRLAPDARRMFRLLGLVPGSDIGTDGAAALAGISADQAALLLHRLAAAHLLSEHALGRFTFHDLLRHYAVDRARHDCGADDRAAATRRLLDWHVHTADEAGRLLYPTMVRLPLPQTETRTPRMVFNIEAQALAWLEAERLNLVAVVRHAAEHGPYAAAWLLADALRGFFWLRRYAVDWLAVAEAALRAAEADGELRAQAAAQLSLADSQHCQTRPQQAIEHYTKALALARQAGWVTGEGAALGNLGTAYRQLGRLEQAADHYNQALTLFRRSGSTASQAVGMASLGYIYLDRGQLARAADHYSQAAALARKAGAPAGEASHHVSLGEAYHGLGQLDQALAHLIPALAVHRETGDRVSEAETLRILAEVHRDAGRPTDAFDLACAAVTLATDTGDRQYQASALNTLATTYLLGGDHRAALDGHRRALRLSRDTESRYPEIVALNGLAAAHRRLGQLERAGARVRRALDLARRAGYRLLEAQALTTMADLDLARGDTGRAADHARQAIDACRETGYRLGEARALTVLGHVLRQVGDGDAAAASWRRALGLLTEIGSAEAGQVQDLLASS